MSEKLLKNKISVYEKLQTIMRCDINNLEESFYDSFSKTSTWFGFHPLNELTNSKSVLETFYMPLRHSFPDLERRDMIFLSGEYESREYIATCGHYIGQFKNDWLGICASNTLVYLRFGEIYQIEDDKIVDSHVIIDLADLLFQIGRWPLELPVKNSPASFNRWLNPMRNNGVNLSSTHAEKKHFNLMRKMQVSLSNTLVAKEDLFNMEQKEYWHPNMMWYGPFPIGTSRGLSGFIDAHQYPFRVAFPERRSGKDHYIRVSDDNFSVTSGWPSVIATHQGDDWLNVKASGKKINMRVMDFYYCEDNSILENWVPIDILDIYLQMDVDILGMIK